MCLGVYDSACVSSPCTTVYSKLTLDFHRGWNGEKTLLGSLLLVVWTPLSTGDATTVWPPDRRSPRQFVSVDLFLVLASAKSSNLHENITGLKKKPVSMETSWDGEERKEREREWARERDVLHMANKREREKYGQSRSKSVRKAFFFFFAIDIKKIESGTQSVSVLIIILLLLRVVYRELFAFICLTWIITTSRLDGLLLYIRLILTRGEKNRK